MNTNATHRQEDFWATSQTEPSRYDRWRPWRNWRWVLAAILMVAMPARMATEMHGPVWSADPMVYWIDFSVAAASALLLYVALPSAVVRVVARRTGRHPAPGGTALQRVTLTVMLAITAILPVPIVGTLHQQALASGADSAALEACGHGQEFVEASQALADANDSATAMEYFVAGQVAAERLAATALLTEVEEVRSAGETVLTLMRQIPDLAASRDPIAQRSWELQLTNAVDRLDRVCAALAVPLPQPA